MARAVDRSGNLPAGVSGADGGFPATWMSIGAVTGALTGAAANSPIFSMRNISVPKLLVRRVGLGFITTTAFTVAQIMDFGLYFARSFSASDSGQTAIALGNPSLNALHRSDMQKFSNNQLDMRVSNAGAITAGTRTLDANPLSFLAGYSGGAGQGIVPAMDNMFKHDFVDNPLELNINEGIVINSITAMGAAGVVAAYVNVELAVAVLSN